MKNDDIIKGTMFLIISAFCPHPLKYLHMTYTKNHYLLNFLGIFGAYNDKFNADMM